MEALLEVSVSDLTLSTLSLIKASISLWELPDIKIKRRNYFSQNDVDSWKLKTWHNITQEVLNLLSSSDIVASTIIPELKDAIVNTGLRIFNWTLFVKMELGLDACYAEEIIWTHLGFVDEQKIFQYVWANDLSLYKASPEIPIFRVACLLAQEDFVKEHQEEMVYELEKIEECLNGNFNFSDEIYGIISTYICYHVNGIIERIIENIDPASITNEYMIFDGIGNVYGDKEVELSKYDFADANKLSKIIKKALSKNSVPPPEKMVLVCTLQPLINGFKYYYGKLNSSQKNKTHDIVTDYYENINTNPNPISRASRMGEIFDIIKSFEAPLSDELVPCSTHFKSLLYHFPLESIICPKLQLLTNLVTFKKNADDLLNATFIFIQLDHYSHSPIRRNVYQKVVKEIWNEVRRSKISSLKEDVLESFIEHYSEIQDFTSLKIILKGSECDDNELQSHYYTAYLRIPKVDGKPLDELDSSNAVAVKQLLMGIFDTSEERDKFLKEKLYDCQSFKKGLFNTWENRFNSLKISNTPLRQLVQPTECLYQLAKRKRYYVCDKFIKWWNVSPEDQLNLKNDFKSSLYPSKFIYKIWLDLDKGKNKSAVKFLGWLFDSVDDRIQFKQEKLSVLGLVGMALDKSENRDFENMNHSLLTRYIDFCGIPSDKISSVKEEVKGKLEDLIFNHASLSNMLTFSFLIDWVSMSDEDLKIILEKLYDSSKFLRFCEEALEMYNYEEAIEFYNKWLKLSGKISDIKNYLISLYTGENCEKFVKKLSGMYEKLERGEVLTEEDLVYEDEIDEMEEMDDSDESGNSDESEDSNESEDSDESEESDF